MERCKLNKDSIGTEGIVMDLENLLGNAGEGRK